jgi:hypothetical protein
MILKKEHVTKAMQLGAGDINRALERGGYTDKVTSVDFVGMTTTGNFVYDTEYFDLDTGNKQTGRVYVSYNSTGLPVADW